MSDTLSYFEWVYNEGREIVKHEVDKLIPAEREKLVHEVEGAYTELQQHGSEY